MAWATPRTWAAGEHPSAAQFNQDIRDNQLAAFPLGVTTWTAWTPTLTNMTLGTGTVVAQYQRVGNLVFYVFRFNLGVGSLMGTSPAFTPPVAHSSVFGNAPLGMARLIDADGPDWEGMARRSGTDINVLYQDGAGNQATITATAPFTWVATDTLEVSGFYLAA